MRLLKRDAETRLVSIGKRKYWVFRYDGQINGTNGAAVILTYPENSFVNPKTLRTFLCTNSESVYEVLACLGVLLNNQGETCSGQISASFRNRNTPVLACDVAHPFPVLCGLWYTALFFRGLRILAKACSA